MRRRPGVINTIMAETQSGARIIVVGVCMEDDHFRPMYGINKELDMQFVLGYSGEEFAASLQNLAEGKINTDVLVTGKVGVDGVAGAFEELASPERHAKILVEPWRNDQRP
jgi:threonine dehydrogenase-like Zn-dependent dehydrogenase